ncbi:hypothetical protein V8D89_013837 [Ganoderma adspersum]
MGVYGKWEWEMGIPVVRTFCSDEIVRCHGVTCDKGTIPSRGVELGLPRLPPQHVIVGRYRNQNRSTISVVRLPQQFSSSTTLYHVIPVYVAAIAPPPDSVSSVKRMPMRCNKWLCSVISKMKAANPSPEELPRGSEESAFEVSIPVVKATSVSDGNDESSTALGPNGPTSRRASDASMYSQLTAHSSGAPSDCSRSQKSSQPCTTNIPQEPTLQDLPSHALSCSSPPPSGCKPSSDPPSTLTIDAFKASSASQQPRLFKLQPSFVEPSIVAQTPAEVDGSTPFSHSKASTLSLQCHVWGSALSSCSSSALEKYECLDLERERAMSDLFNLERERTRIALLSETMAGAMYGLHPNVQFAPAETGHQLQVLDPVLSDNRVGSVSTKLGSVSTYLNHHPLS